MSASALFNLALSSRYAVEDDHPREASNHFAGGKNSDQQPQPTFEDLFRRYAPIVLHALPFLGVAEADIDDLCQDVFITVHQKLSTFEGRSTLKTWIYGICLRKVSNYHKRAYRRLEYTSEKFAEQAVQTEQVQHIQHDQQREILEEAMASLSEKKRAVFVLFEIEELSMEEVAAIVGCPVFTGYARLYAARRDVKKTVRRLLNTRSIGRISP